MGYNIENIGYSIDFNRIIIVEGSGTLLLNTLIWV